MLLVALIMSHRIDAVLRWPQERERLKSLTLGDETKIVYKVCSRTHHAAVELKISKAAFSEWPDQLFFGLNLTSLECCDRGDSSDLVAKSVEEAKKIHKILREPRHIRGCLQSQCGPWLFDAPDWFATLAFLMSITLTSCRRASRKSLSSDDDCKTRTSIQLDSWLSSSSSYYTLPQQQDSLKRKRRRNRTDTEYVEDLVQSIHRGLERYSERPSSILDPDEIVENVRALVESGPRRPQVPVEVRRFLQKQAKCSEVLGNDLVAHAWLLRYFDACVAQWTTCTGKDYKWRNVMMTINALEDKLHKKYGASSRAIFVGLASKCILQKSIEQSS